jgi:hypothetical protein
MGTGTGLSEYMFDWKNPKISTWKKCLRIVYKHGFEDIRCKGNTAQEISMELLRLHEKELTPEELEFVKGLLR